MSHPDRMPPLAVSELTDKQRRIVDEFTKGPRGGVKGPFIPALRSPELVDRLGKLGEYLRFESSLAPRIGEFVMLIVAREWTNQFEWAVHVPLALKNGIRREIVDALAEGRHPHGMAEDEALAFEVCGELTRTRSLCDTTSGRAVETFGEAGVIDLATLYGYFVTVCAIMNLAHTPPPADTKVNPIAPFPL